ncbi:MAG: hypothetical protein LBC17_03130 [Lactobacillaceae bacterium]|jgi:predicted small secreted protein|nr:hypothetical protein [Lactobacillaceae bacterium]
MNKKNKSTLFVLAGITAIGTALLTKFIDKEILNSPANILNNIKKELSQIGTVGSSWINSTPSVYNGINVYEGIVEITEADQKYNLSFKANINTGQVLKMEKVQL